MVPWAAKAKWRSGWRNINDNSHHEAFVKYWDYIVSHLHPSPLLPPAGGHPASPCCLLGRLGAVRSDAPPFLLAPMVLQSERAFRLLVRSHGVAACFSPMILASEVTTAGGLGCPVAAELMRPCLADRPVIAQLAGSDPAVMAEAAHMLAPFVDAVDVNFGCPQQCAVLGGYGAPFAAAHPDKAVDVVRSLAMAGLGIPVSAKIRLLGEGGGHEEDDDDSLAKTVTFARRLEDAGASFITLHGRRLSQRDHQHPDGALAALNLALQRPADLDAIRAVKAALRIPVVCNGNVRSIMDARRCLAYTGCDGVMSAVGLLRYPRLFHEAATRTSHGMVDGGHEDEQGVSPYMDSRTGVLVDRAEALSCAWEYLLLAEAHPPPEARSIRDHLKAILQGVLQWRDEYKDVWDLLGNDRRIGTTAQFFDLLRLTAARGGDVMLANLGGWGEGGPKTLKDIRNQMLVDSRQHYDEQGEGAEGDDEGDDLGALFGEAEESDW